MGRALTDPEALSNLRASDWSGIPSSPGVYWWYFPPTALHDLRVSVLCDVSKLRLRYSVDGKVCLYHGMANNLAERVRWHAAQKLALSSLRSGFLSTFRFTLLALNDFDYLQEPERIDRYFDQLSIAWQAAPTRGDAQQIEHAELLGEYSYPLNIQRTRSPELLPFTRHLRSSRIAYKQRYIPTIDPP